MNRPGKTTHRREAAGSSVLPAPATGRKETIRELRLQHSDLRRLLGRIAALFSESRSADKAVEVGDPLATAFQELWSRMLVHMAREERLVFPAISPLAEECRRNDRLQSGIEWAQQEHEGFRSSIANLQLIIDTEPGSARAVSVGALLRKLYSDFFIHVGEEEQLFAPLAATPSGMTREETR